MPTFVLCPDVVLNKWHHYWLLVGCFEASSLIWSERTSENSYLDEIGIFFVIPCFMLFLFVLPGHRSLHGYPKYWPQILGFVNIFLQMWKLLVGVLDEFFRSNRPGVVPWSTRRPSTEHWCSSFCCSSCCFCSMAAAGVMKPSVSTGMVPLLVAGRF